MKCAICQEPIMSDMFSVSHNAEPVAKGRCCAGCNLRKVIPARLADVNTGVVKPDFSALEERCKRCGACKVVYGPELNGIIMCAEHNKEWYDTARKAIKEGKQ